MSNNFISGAGTEIKIGSDVIGDIDRIGGFGATTQVIRHQPLDGETYKKAGSRDSGTLTLTGARVFDDVGQNAMETASNDRSVQTFSIELANPLTPTTGTGTTFTFSGVVTQFQTEVSGPDNKVTLNATIEITGPISKAAAT